MFGKFFVLATFCPFVQPPRQVFPILGIQRSIPGAFLIGKIFGARGVFCNGIALARVRGVSSHPGLIAVQQIPQ